MSFTTPSPSTTCPQAITTKLHPRVVFFKNDPFAGARPGASRAAVARPGASRAARALIHPHSSTNHGLYRPFREASRQLF